MGEILGIGCTHGPHLALPDERMADIYFRRNLHSDLTPPAWKDPNNWPAAMREEWGDDEGASAAHKHRAELVKGFREARAALDAFNPDFVLIFGDDQYENFREDLIPPFCVYALDECNLAARRGGGEGRPAGAGSNGEQNRAASAGPIPTASVLTQPVQPTVPGHKQAGTFLANGLTQRGFDVACSWKMHHMAGLGHAFVSTVSYLDWDRKGFPYPVIPFHVNCYGSGMRVPTADQPEGSVVGRLMQNVQILPPESPPPWRCYDLGKAVAEIIEISPWRAAVIGSSSWSHASLTAKHDYMYPDIEADRERFNELKAGKQYKWRDLDPAQIRDSGQHETLNWVCLAGAMHGRKPEILAYSETYIFNSSKTVALFPVEAQQAVHSG